LRSVTLQGFPVVSVSPNLLGFEVILSWSWLLSEVCLTFDRPVCSSPLPTLSGRRQRFINKRPCDPDWLS